MDFIGQLSQQMGVNPQQAQGLAGSLLKLVQGTVQEKLGPEASQQMEHAIPEMQGWQRQAEAQHPPASESGGLMGALGGMLGGGGGGGGGGGAGGGLLGSLGGLAAQAGEVAGVVSLLQRFNIDGGKAALVAPLLLNFLKSRLDPKLVSGILTVVPLLAGAAGGQPPEGGGGGAAGGGGLGGLLGGLIR
jgi:hypothetical protein